MSENNGIHQAMANVLKDLRAIGKNNKNEGPQKYNYRGIDDIYNEIKPLFGKYGVYCMPEVIDYEMKQLSLSPDRNGNPRSQSMTTAIVMFKFYHSDGSSVSCKTIGEGRDSGDKSMNKALIAAHKYALTQILCIPTEDVKMDDADRTDPEEPILPEMATEDQRRELGGLLVLYYGEGETKLFMEGLTSMMGRRVKSSAELTREEADEAIESVRLWLAKK